MKQSITVILLLIGVLLFSGCLASERVNNPTISQMSIPSTPVVTTSSPPLYESDTTWTFDNFDGEASYYFSNAIIYNENASLSFADQDFPRVIENLMLAKTNATFAREYYGNASKIAISPADLEYATLKIQAMTSYLEALDADTLVAEMLMNDTWDRPAFWETFNLSGRKYTESNEKYQKAEALFWETYGPQNSTATS